MYIEFAAERWEYPLRGVIPLGDMFFEGMVMYYDLSIKAKDFED
jgi:hypothetical protein